MEEEEEEETSSSATGIRSSRSFSLSLLAITIADLSSPITNEATSFFFNLFIYYVVEIFRFEFKLLHRKEPNQSVSPIDREREKQVPNSDLTSFLFLVQYYITLVSSFFFFFGEIVSSIYYFFLFSFFLFVSIFFFLCGCDWLRRVVVGKK